MFWNPLTTLGSAHLVRSIEQNHWQDKDNSKKKKVLSVPEYNLFRCIIYLFFDGVVEFQNFYLALWYILAKQKVFHALRALITEARSLNPNFQREVLTFSAPLLAQ